MLANVLHGIRTALKSDLQVSSAVFLYGQTLRFPEDYSNHVDNSNHYDALYAKPLASYMHRIRLSNTRVANQHSFVSSELATCSHVYLRIDVTRRALERHYEGQFCVLQLKDKVFIIDRHDKCETVSLNRRNPAHLEATSSESIIPASTTPLP